MDEYLTPEANDTFSKVASVRKRRKVLLRMLAFVNDKISSYGENIPLKYLERRDTCILKYKQTEFKLDQALYNQDKLVKNGLFFK